MESPVFRSRIDAVFVILLVAPFLLIAGLVVRDIMQGRGPGAVVVGTLVASAALVLWIFTTTRYVFTETALQVTSGPLRVTVPLASIRKVARTNSLWSSPALSMRRLEISYGTYDSVIISPDDEAGFIAQLQARVPGVVLPPPA